MDKFEPKMSNCLLFQIVSFGRWHRVSQGYDYNDIDESMEAKMKKKNCIKYLLFLYFYRS